MTAPKKRVPWTDADDDQLLNLRRDEHKEFEDIAVLLRRTKDACQVRYSIVLKRRGLRGRRKAETAREFAGASLSQLAAPETIRDRDRRAELRGQQDFTSSFFGDPPPGYSALDKMRERA